jgi:hypothetical protein
VQAFWATKDRATILVSIKEGIGVLEAMFAE